MSCTAFGHKKKEKRRKKKREKEGKKEKEEGEKKKGADPHRCKNSGGCAPQTPPPLAFLE